MKPQKTIFLIIVFIALGLYVYLFETSTPDKKEPPKPVKALEFIAEDIQEVEIKKEGRRVLLKKYDDTWKVIEPVEAEAKAGMVNDLLKLFDYGIVRVIEDEPADKKLFGLDMPLYEFGIKGKNDRTFKTLFIGDDAPGNLSCYGMIDGSPRVILLGVRYRQEVERAFKTFSEPAEKTSN